MVEGSDDAIASKTLDGIVTSWNSAAERLFGYTAGEMIGQPIAILSAPVREAEMQMILEQIRRGERVGSIDTVRRRKDGSLVEISLTVSPIYDDEGHIVGASKIARDITERRAVERQQQLLLNELDHRVRNTLAIVFGLTSRTLSDGPEREALLGRLQAIAFGQTLLAAQGRGPVNLNELVTAELSPYSERVQITGEDLPLHPRALTTLSLVIHELATNAVKHGSLSLTAGQVKVAWEVDDGQIFCLRWLESGGPLVADPQWTGYGTQLLETTPALSFRAKTRMEFKPEGLSYELVAPLSAIATI